jgi:hypothetical protein
MIPSMYIGSGDVSALLAGLDTESHQKLLRRFVSGEIPYYNAKNSPIDACRTGAILEDRYFQTLDDGWYPQFKVVSNEMDVFRASLDFARLEFGNVVEIQELKCIEFDDFRALCDSANKLAYVKKKYKTYYNQVQEQMYCANLDNVTMTFVAVYSYDDDVNNVRDIQENETNKVIINRDEAVISLIKERGKHFQMLKDIYNK